MIKQEKYYVGLDLSLTGTGLIVLNQDQKIIEQKLISTKSNMEIEERIMKIWDEIKFIENIIHRESIGIEGISYGSSKNPIIFSELVALNFYVRIKLKENNINPIIIAPTSLKKFVTGKGNIKKELMLKEIFKRWGADFNDNNLADAYALAMFVLDKGTTEKMKEIKSGKNKKIQ